MSLALGQSSSIKNFPVVETVLSVQFEPLASIRTAHLGLLWNEFLQDYPETDQRSPLPQVIEPFPPKAGTGITELRFLGEMPIPRVWFVSSSKGQMIQVQNDRFIKNWRKEGDENYPRYFKGIRPGFDRDYVKFCKFLEKNRLGAPSINQCEITYLNHIVAGDGWERFGDFAKVFTFWASPPDCPVAEDLSVQVRFVIPSEQGKPIGRLHADIRPATRNSDGQPMYVMNLTARGQLGSGLDFFDVGHEWIVRTFKSLAQARFHD